MRHIRRLINRHSWVVVVCALFLVYAHSTYEQMHVKNLPPSSSTIPPTPITTQGAKAPTVTLIDETSAYDKAESETDDGATPSLTPAYIVRVVDGDTIRVRIEEKEYTVRLIGMDAPETVDPRKPVQCFGKEASAVLAELTGGKEVWLATDDTQDEKDRYGRLLRYVYLDDDTNVAEYMIRNGFAFEYTYREPYRYQKLFRQAQGSAEYEGVGLWAPDACGELEKPEE